MGINQVYQKIKIAWNDRFPSDEYAGLRIGYILRPYVPSRKLLAQTIHSLIVVYGKREAINVAKEMAAEMVVLPEKTKR